MNDWFGLVQKRRYGYRDAESWLNRRKWTRSTIIKYVAIAGAIGFTLSVLFVFIMFAWFSRDLPSPESIVRRSGFSTKIVDRNGKLLYDLYTDYNRVPVKIEDIPESLQQATIAIEDKEFFTHKGYDMIGVVRGIWRLVSSGHAIGGSTITQQLVKNVLLTPDRSIIRKVKELILAIQIERKFTKAEILQMYFNEAPYGGTAIGIGAASERYFGKPVKDLTLLETVVLAGMPQAPSRYSPYGSNPQAYVSRAISVLRRMREDGYITVAQEAELTLQLPNVSFQEAGRDIKAPHFVFYVKDQLVELLGDGVIEQGGYTVTTSLDYDLQEFAQNVVAEEIGKVQSLNIGNGSAMVMNPQTGEILAMVGSKNYFDADYDGKVNVTLASRQPGSTIKPVTYAAAFLKGYSPATMLLDVPTKFPGANEGEAYEPKNYDGKFNGPVQLRFALGSSLNIPAVKLLSLVGVKDMLTLAYDMGFESLAPTPENMKRFGLSVTLGGGEVRLFDLVHAYSAFANGGDKVLPVSILKVEREGQKIYEAKWSNKTRVLTPEVAFLINHVLYDNNARLLTFGNNSLLNMGGKPIAVKTGTTNDRRDNWAIGWSTKAVVGVWVGNNDNSQMKAVASGTSGASPIWRRITLKAWEMYKGDEFTIPEGVEVRQIDVVSGYTEHDGYQARAEYFGKGTVPTVPDPIHTKLKICRGMDPIKLARDVDIARGEYDEREFFVLKSESKNWIDDIGAWTSTQEDKRYQPPSDYCDTNTDTVIGFDGPADRSQIDGDSVAVKITVTTSQEIEYVKLYVDDKETESFSSKYINTNLSLPKGSYSLKAKVRTKNGTESETVTHIGVKQAWDYVAPTPTPTATPIPTIIPSPTLVPSPTPLPTP